MTAPDFASRLAWALEQEQRTNRAIASLAGCDPARLAEWSTGRVEPLIGSVQAISRAMPWLSIEWLVTGRGGEYFRP